jgi:hypothetical protein
MQYSKWQAPTSHARLGLALGRSDKTARSIRCRALCTKRRTCKGFPVAFEYVLAFWLIGTTYRRHVSLRHDRYQSSTSDQHHATYLIDKSFPPKSHHATSPHCNVSIQYLSLHQAYKTSCHRFKSRSLTIPNSHALA